MRSTALLLAGLLLASSARAAAPVQTGLDVLAAEGFAPLRGKRVGLITNQTGLSRDGKSNVDLLARARGVSLAALFSPEHGFSGSVEDGDVSSGSLKLADGRVIPIHSLYGDTQSPTPAMLAGLDALVFDIQDVGARFYTYAATMGMAMEAAAAGGLDFYVLDRPNPISGEIVEGALLDPDIRHITAYFPVPVRHGLTIGELARLHARQKNISKFLHVVAMRGWTRELWYDETGLPWTKPSPNMPDLASAALYPGIACLESANLSVGRGTTHPFLWVGAPWLDAEGVLERLKAAGLEGVQFSLKNERPTKSIYQGAPCRGIELSITDRAKLRPLRVFAHLVCALRDLNPKQFDIHPDGTRRMVGSERFMKLYAAGAPPERMIELFDADAERFRAERRADLLY